MQYGASIWPCQVSPGQHVQLHLYWKMIAKRRLQDYLQTQSQAWTNHSLDCGLAGFGLWSPKRRLKVCRAVFLWFPASSFFWKNQSINKNVSRIQRHQYLWLVQSSSPSPGCPVFHCRLYWIYLFLTIWSPLQYGCACLRHQGATSQHCVSQATVLCSLTHCLALRKAKADSYYLRAYVGSFRGSKCSRPSCGLSIVITVIMTSFPLYRWKASSSILTVGFDCRTPGLMSSSFLSPCLWWYL